MRSLAVFNGEVLRSGGLLVTPQPSPAGGHRWWISEGRGLLPGQGWGLPRGHTWGPRSGHQWGLSHGHGHDRHGSTQREVEAVLDELAGRSVTPRKTVDMAPPSSRPVGEGLLRVGKGALYTSHRTAPLPWGNVFPDPRRKPSARPAPNWP